MISLSPHFLHGPTPTIPDSPLTASWGQGGNPCFFYVPLTFSSLSVISHHLLITFLVSFLHFLDFILLHLYICMYTLQARMCLRDRTCVSVFVSFLSPYVVHCSSIHFHFSLQLNQIQGVQVPHFHYVFTCWWTFGWLIKFPCCFEYA